MKFKLQHIFRISFFALLMLSSCQDESVVNNLDESIILPQSTLAMLISDSVDDEASDCVSFQYPIVFSIYNSSFQIIETITVNSDADLEAFFESVEEETQGVILASLNFPVTLVFADGNTTEVQNNQELETEISLANTDCELAENTCTEDEITAYLQTCIWHIDLPNGNNNYENYNIIFYDNGSFSMSNGITTEAIGGSWIAVTTNDFVSLTITELTAYAEDLQGDWIVDVCNDDYLLLTRTIDGVSTQITLEQDCVDDEVFECFESSPELEACNDNGIATFDLTEAWSDCEYLSQVEMSYYETLYDADIGVNAIYNPTVYTAIANAQIIYVRVEFEDLTYQIYEIYLNIIDCSPCENPAVLSDDLVVYMPFSEVAKEIISDYTAQNITNTFVEDRSGNASCAIAFDGTNEITIPITTNSEIDQNDDFSISLWFKMQNNIAGDFETFYKLPGNATQGYQLGVYDLNTPLFSDNIGFSIWDNDWNQEVDVVWQNTNWHHLVITVDANNTVRMYRDGIQRNITENSSLNIGSESGGVFYLGDDFVGHLDDLRIYKRTLNANEISQLYNLEGECYECI